MALTLKQTKTFINQGALIAWMLWSLTSLTMIFSKNADPTFIISYFLYLVIGGILLWTTRHDLLSPLGLIVFTGFLAFGLNIPLLYGENRRIETSDLTAIVVTDDMLIKVMIVFLIATLSFVLGYYSRIHKYFPSKKLLSIKQSEQKATIPSYFIILTIVLGAGIIRIALHLGEAGIQPNIPFAGVIQYVLYDGLVLLSATYICLALRRGRLFLLLGMSLLLCLAITQALLGWRGGIVHMIYIAMGLFWYQIYRNRRKPPISIAWIVILLALSTTVVQLGNQVRAERLGGEKVFSTSIGDFFEKLAFRGQGTLRLGAIVEHVGSISLFNHFFIFDLAAQHMTTTAYVDKKLYAVAAYQSNSYGTSGPGSPYLGMGLFGVLCTYALLGAFYRNIHELIFSVNNNVLAITFYSYLIYILPALMSENFSTAFLKNMTAAFTLLFLIKIFITKGLSGFKQIRFRKLPAKTPAHARHTIELKSKQLTRP